MTCGLKFTCANISAALPFGARIIGTAPIVTQTEKRLSAIICKLDSISVSLVFAELRAKMRHDVFRI